MEQKSRKIIATNPIFGLTASMADLWWFLWAQRAVITGGDTRLHEPAQFGFFSKLPRRIFRPVDC